MRTATELLLWGIIAHLVADWLLQNAWMSDNKANPRHPAGYVHAGLHLLALALIFPWPAAIALAVSHWFIDLRFALVWWRRTIRQTTEGPAALHVAIWGDQVLHVVCLAVAAAAAWPWAFF